MFTTGKRVFAGKPRLVSEPLCPFTTDDSGLVSLLRSQLAQGRVGVRAGASQVMGVRGGAGAGPGARSNVRGGAVLFNRFTGAGVKPHARPSIRDGRHRM